MSSSGGIGGAGTDKADALCCIFSISASLIDEGPAFRDLSKVKYGAGNAPGSSFGKLLRNVSVSMRLRKCLLHTLDHHSEALSLLLPLWMLELPLRHSGELSQAVIPDILALFPHRCLKSLNPSLSWTLSSKTRTPRSSGPLLAARGLLSFLYFYQVQSRTFLGEIEASK